MATVEPHLIHLVNQPSQGRDLPSIQSLPLGTPGSESLSLPPLESDHGRGNDGAALLPSSATTQIPPFHHLVGIDVPRPTAADNVSGNDGSSQLTSSARPLHLLLGEEPGINTATLPFRRGRLSTSDITPHDGEDDIATKKRHHALSNKDDSVQLPQPLKKQRSIQQVMPPIIAGLKEPPPNPHAYSLPPISDCIGGADALSIVPPFRDSNYSAEELMGHGAAVPLSDGEHMNKTAGLAKTKRRAAKPRRKWTEEETNALLLGVSRHGVGKWTNILEDQDFSFNNRTAADLKDRFRTCCPAELQDSFNGQGKKKNAEPLLPAESWHLPEFPINTATGPAQPINNHQSYPNNPLHFRNILIEPETVSTPPRPPSTADQDAFHQYSYPQSQPDSDSGKPQRKTRAHRKNMDDLKALGIDGPFKKARRRERRVFTLQDDTEILDGLEKYGPAWTKIQRDPQYNLKSRQPTDLRDRVRNKYPHVYASIEKGHFNGKEAKAAGLLEPAINAIMERSLNNKSSYEDEPTDRCGTARRGRHSRSASPDESITGVSWLGTGPGGAAYPAAGRELCDRSSYEDMARHTSASPRPGNLGRMASKEEIQTGATWLGLGPGPGGTAYPTTTNEVQNRTSYDDLPASVDGSPRKRDHRRMASKEDVNAETTWSRPGPGVGINTGSHGASSDMDINRMLSNDISSPSAPRLSLLHTIGIGSRDPSHHGTFLRQPRPGRYPSGLVGSNALQPGVTEPVASLPGVKQYYNPVHDSARDKRL